MNILRREMNSGYFEKDLLIGWLDFWLLGPPSLKSFPFLVIPALIIEIGTWFMSSEAPVLEVVEAGVIGRLEDHVHPTEPWPVHPLLFHSPFPLETIS